MTRALFKTKGSKIRATSARMLQKENSFTEFLLYTTPNGKVKVEIFLHDENIWLTQKRMADLFGVGIPAVNKHLKNIFENGELQEDSVISILETIAGDGKTYDIGSQKSASFGVRGSWLVFRLRIMLRGI